MATKKDKPQASDMDERIREFFERNYELLRMESGQVLTNELKREALDQVLFYYKKLKHVAESVSRTEVHLALPEQRTAQDRRFTIEGVVDVVEEGEETWLYDIKTHDPAYVRQHPGRYAEQLNVYAHIWQNLQRRPLHHTAVIATKYPRAMKQAWRRGDMPTFRFEFERWEPLIELPFDQGRLEETLSSFGEVVDRIEGKEFPPRTVEDLESGGRRKFGTRVCRNCDARFSCSSYRAFARKRKVESATSAKYFTDPATDADQNDWLDGNMETLPSET